MLTLPSTPPFVTTPGFPPPPKPTTGGSTTGKTLTNARKLANALKACAKRPKKQRASCRKSAYRRYHAKPVAR
jgi:hypothetical protein